MAALENWRLKEILMGQGISGSSEEIERMRRQHNTDGSISGTGLAESVQDAINRDRASKVQEPDPEEKNSGSAPAP